CQSALNSESHSAAPRLSDTGKTVPQNDSCQTLRRQLCEGLCTNSFWSIREYALLRGCSMRGAIGRVTDRSLPIRRLSDCYAIPRPKGCAAPTIRNLLATKSAGKSNLRKIGYGAKSSRLFPKNSGTSAAW